jgi:dihydroorotate dehydrogenase electron transfer subunit
MLRAWDRFPVLSRPISVHDADRECVSFLCKIVGQGTERFAALRPGDDLVLNGPYGNGYPQEHGKIALVGGGTGVAPLYFAAKALKKDPASTVDLFLGFSGEEMLHREFEAVGDSLTVNVGGFITDDIHPSEYDAIFSCGPEVMMRALWKKCKAEQARARVYVSMEQRMACGVGACLGCTIPTAAGRRRVCKDGPVFRAEEVFFHE